MASQKNKFWNLYNIKNSSLSSEDMLNISVDSEEVNCKDIDTEQCKFEMMINLKQRDITEF